VYEQNDVPMFRRILLIGLAAIAVIVVLWAVLWLLFIRSDGKAKTPTSHKTTTSQSRKSSDSSKSTASAPAGSSIAAPGNSSTQSSTSAQSSIPTSSTAPTELVNTGAGSLVVPFVVASVAGTTFYYIRTRKQLVN
jgi:cytoskeletal protein RodZ